jgi:hypothetical protein
VGAAVKGTVEDGTVHRNGQPVAETATPVWKKPPQIRLSLGSLSLGDEILADRGSDPTAETNR